MSVTLTNTGINPLSGGSRTAFIEKVAESKRSGESAKIADIPVMPSHQASGNEQDASLFEERNKEETDIDKIYVEFLNTTADVLDVQDTNVLSPYGLVDPTKPLPPLLEKIDIEIDTSIEFTLYAMANIKDFTLAFKSFEECETKDLAQLLANAPNETLTAEEIDEKLQTACADFSLGLPELPEIPVPELPEFPYLGNFDMQFKLPMMTLPNIGIVNVFLELIKAAINAITTIVNKVIEKITDFIIAIGKGIAALIEFLLNLIIDLILQPIIFNFPNLFSIPGFVALITATIAFVAGMLLVTMTGVLLGTGMIAKGVADVLGLT